MFEHFWGAFDIALVFAFGYDQPGETVDLVNVKVKLSGVLTKPS